MKRGKWKGERRRERVRVGKRRKHNFYVYLSFSLEGCGREKESDRKEGREGRVERRRGEEREQY